MLQMHAGLMSSVSQRPSPGRTRTLERGEAAFLCSSVLGLYMGAGTLGL